MIIYEQPIETTQQLVPAKLHCVYHDTEKPLFVFLQESRGWCPYRKIVTDNRTLRVKLDLSENALRKYMLYNSVYIRAVYANEPLIKDSECDYDEYNKQIAMQLMTEHEMPIIDEFGMYVYMRLEMTTEASKDVDLRYDSHLSLEMLYNHDLRNSIALTGTGRIQVGDVSPSLVGTE